MALSQDIAIEIGSKQLVFANAYAKVSEYHGNKQSMTFVVSWSEVSSGSSLRQATYKCPVDLSGENPIRQAYLYLKTLPEFANAVDC